MSFEVICIKQFLFTKTVSSHNHYAENQQSHSECEFHVFLFLKANKVKHECAQQHQTSKFFFFMFNDRRERGTTLAAIYDSAVAEPGEGPAPPYF